MPTYNPDNEANHRVFEPSKPISVEDQTLLEQRHEAALLAYSSKSVQELVSRLLRSYPDVDVIIHDHNGADHYYVWSAGGRGRGNKRGHMHIAEYTAFGQAVKAAGRSFRHVLLVKL